MFTGFFHPMCGALTQGEAGALAQNDTKTMLLTTFLGQVKRSCKRIQIPRNGRLLAINKRRIASNPPLQCFYGITSSPNTEAAVT